MFFITGCWDSRELNDRAIELAWGIDKAKNKNILISTQVLIPSKMGGGQGAGGGSGGSEGPPFFVKTGIGKDTLDAVAQMQTKLSRQLFRGQRRVIVIGEPQARRGIKDILDTYTRDPNINLLTEIFIIKGGTAKNFLETSYQLENIPALGALKEYNHFGSLKEVGFLNFLLSATSEGSCPTLPAIAIESPSSSSNGGKQKGQSNAKGFRIAGAGIFNKDLKLIGFLNVEETRALRWITGNLDKLTITAFVPQGQGYLSLDVNKMSSKIQPIIQRNNIKILITLTGQGMIKENNSSLDLTKIKNITLAQNAFDKRVEKFVEKSVTKIQKEYGTDVFGFGEVTKRKYLHQWKSLKKSWDKEFPEVEISVKANMTVRRIGVTGPSILKRE